MTDHENTLRLMRTDASVRTFFALARELGIKKFNLEEHEGAWELCAYGYRGGEYACLHRQPYPTDLDEAAHAKLLTEFADRVRAVLLEPPSGTMQSIEARDPGIPPSGKG